PLRPIVTGVGALREPAGDKHLVALVLVGEERLGEPAKGGNPEEVRLAAPVAHGDGEPGVALSILLVLLLRVGGEPADYRDAVIIHNLPSFLLPAQTASLRENGVYIPTRPRTASQRTA